MITTLSIYQDWRDRLQRRCADCNSIAYCAVDCAIAPWNQNTAPLTRFACLRRMVRWVGGRFALDKREVRWIGRATR